MLNNQQIIQIDRRNMAFNILPDRSKIQTFTPTIFTMSNQQQETAEKSVQTQQDTLPTGLPINSTENTTAEVANTLVSMATGRQRATPITKQSNGNNISNQSTSLPIISLADYTTFRGVPTASALANQAKLTTRKQDNSIENHHDDASMSTDENISIKRSQRGKKSTTKSKDSSTIDAIQYGPILVKPRKRIAPTLSNGRKSKDEPLPHDEDIKRRLRRDRNKQAAAKCRRKRNDLRLELEKAAEVLDDQQLALRTSVETLSNQKQQLEYLLAHHPCLRKTHLPTTNSLNLSKNDIKTIPINPILDPNNTKRVTINLTNAQDLFALAPLTRSTSNTDNSSASASSTTVPMITIHIIPEVAQALLGSTSVDKAKLVELLQQANAVSLPQTTTTTTTNNNINNDNNTHMTSDTTNSTN